MPSDAARPPKQLSIDELESYLHTNIPLTRAMQVTVRGISDQGVTLAAPFAPNINHHETVFGGSVSTLATLAAWYQVHTRLLSEGIVSRLVIQRSTMEYEAQMCGDFTATSAFAREGDWPGFLKLLRRRGKARIAVTALVASAGEIAGQFHGEFVALEAGHARAETDV